MDVCDEIEGGSTLSEAMAKCPKAFDRLYVNMIKAGEAGGALEVILPPPGRVPGTVAVAQTQGQRRDDLPGRRHHGGRRHLDVHHDQDRAGVRQRSSTTSTAELPADDRGADHHLELRGQLLVPDPAAFRSASGCSSS